jgi:hypothetical protein
MKIKVEPFLMKKGNRLAKAAIEFEPTDDPILANFQLVGFTICEDAKRGLFVLFPSAETELRGSEMASETLAEKRKKNYFFFLRPNQDGLLDMLESRILDVYESMVSAAPTKK